MGVKAARLAQLAAVKERPATIGPERVIWQITRACDLCCAPCRSELANLPSSDQLTLDEGLSLIEQLRRCGQPELVLTGGDPFKRTDLGTLVLYAHRLGLPVGLTLSGTPRTTPRMVGLLKAAGLDHIAFCIDGPDEATHDGFRHVAGSFGWTLDGVRVAQGIGLPIRVETSVVPSTVAHLDATAALVARLGAREWQVTFGNRPERDPGAAFTVEEHTQAMRRLASLQGTVNFRVRITPAPYFAGGGGAINCGAPWRPLELFIGDDGSVERWNTGQGLGNVRRDALGAIVRRALQPTGDPVPLANAS